ncbi:MAG: hypothetical protein U9Q00_06550 [Synergistota bacterium]|nr:hypothetical protein [Synergistota bacterium]
MRSESGTTTAEKGYKVTEVGVIPEEWKVVTVKDLLLSLEAGVSVNSENRAASSSEKGILKTSSTTSNRFLPTENKVILENEISRARVSPVADSLIISRMNTPDLVGAAGYVAENYPNLFLPDRLWLAKVRSRACARWFFSVLCSNKMKEQIRNAATGTSPTCQNRCRMID